MPDRIPSLEAQRRLLQSLGFGFVEEPAPIPDESKTAGSRPRTPPRQAPPRRDGPPARATRPPIASIPATDPAEREAALSRIADKAAQCALCPLHLTRTGAAAGKGSPTARLVLIREIPEKDEEKADPYSGEIGEMLGKMVQAMKLTPEDVFVTAGVKCRPVPPRVPRTDELAACEPYLAAQLEVIRPQAVVTFGAAAFAGLFGGKSPALASIRGQWQDYRGVPVMPTFSLPYIQRNTARKKVVWGDLQEVMKRLG